MAAAVAPDAQAAAAVTSSGGSKRRRDASAVKAAAVAAAAKLSPKQRLLKRVRMLCSNVLSAIAASKALCDEEKDDALTQQLQAFGLMRSFAQATMDALKPSEDEITLTLVRHGFVPGDKTLRAAHPTGLGVMYDATIEVVGRSVVCRFPGALAPIKDPLLVLKALLQTTGELTEALDVDADVAKDAAKEAKARSRASVVPPGARMHIPAVVLRVCGMDRVRLPDDEDARVDVVVGHARDLKAPMVLDLHVKSAPQGVKPEVCRVHAGVLLRLLHASSPDLIAAAKALAAKKVSVTEAIGGGEEDADAENADAADAANADTNGADHSTSRMDDEA